MALPIAPPKPDQSRCILGEILVERRAQELFKEHQQNVFRQTDRLFARLMLAQWLVSVGLALWVTPRTWIGATSQVHPHVVAALVLGALLTIPARHARGRSSGRARCGSS